jgi:predicted Rossmann-fold nucleotide-binding protein
VVVCGGGGPGTASEAAHALKAGKPLILLAAPQVWHAFFHSLDPGVGVAADAQECCGWIAAVLGQIR